MEETTLFDISELDNLIDEFATRKAKFDEEKKELDAMNKKIVAALEKQALTSYTNDKHKATVTYKKIFKYPDEQKLFEYLKSNEAKYGFYLVTKVDATALNDLIKKNSEVAEELKELYTMTTSSSLSVK